MAAKKNIAQYLDDILKRFDEGETIRSIAKHYECCSKSISSIVKKHREIKPPRGQQKEIVAQVYHLYQNGYTVKEIQLKLGISNATVRTILKRDYGVVFEGGSKKKEFEHLRDDFIKEYESGSSLTDIAKKYGVSRSTVLNYLNDQQLRGRSYSESKRVYEINEDYFNHLDTKKSRQLGMIYGMGSLIKRSHGNILRVMKVKKYKSFIFEAVDGLTESPSERYYYGIHDVAIIDIHTNKVHDLLASWNFPNELPKSDELDIDAFWEGFICVNANFLKSDIGISIPFGNEKLKQLGVSYLKEKFNLSMDAIVSDDKNAAWMGEENVKKLLQAYPQLVDKLIDKEVGLISSK